MQHAAWPEATVAAVPEPGGAPVMPSVRARQDAGSPGEAAHWEVTGGGRADAGKPTGEEAGGT
jgi:hypothetical protein